MAVPYTFGSATTSIPLSQLDSNFATTITLGNTAIQLGNTVTTLNNMTLANVTISSGTSNLAATAITNGTSNVTIASSGGNIAMATNGATAITVDTSQNVGIGTTTPTTKLSVRGTASMAYGNASASFSDNVTGSLYILHSSGRVFVSSDTAFAFGSGASATERARITSDGNFLWGVTTLAGVSGADAKGIDYTDGMRLFSSRGNTGAREHIIFYNPNGDVGSIDTSASATAYNTSSDYRLKENIAPMTGALAKVAQLKPCTYKWKVDGSDGEGFIAHELAEVKPDCVTGEKDEVETYLDDEGNEQTRIKPQGIDTSFLVATLTAAIQELKAINDTQAETINALTARIVALEAK
jgi:hypothetical protein